MSKYYSLKEIYSKDTQYNMIYAKSVNREIYTMLKHGVERYCKNSEQLAIVRRWGDDFRGNLAQDMFEALVANDEISKITGGEWNSIYYFSSRWYLCRYEDDKRIVDDTPLAYGFSITSIENDTYRKLSSFPGVTSVILI